MTATGIAQEGGPSAPCALCEALIQWLGESWPESAADELPAFLPRSAQEIVKIHNEQAGFMPFCEVCSRFFIQAMSLFHRERQAREGQEPKELKARVEQRLVTPQRPGIVLPGQPGFKAP